MKAYKLAIEVLFFKYRQEVIFQKFQVSENLPTDLGYTRCTWSLDSSLRCKKQAHFLCSILGNSKFGLHLFLIELVTWVLLAWQLETHPLFFFWWLCCSPTDSSTNRSYPLNRPLGFKLKKVFYCWVFQLTQSKENGFRKLFNVRRRKKWLKMSEP